MKRAVVITGAAGGVGRGIVAEFRAAGWRTFGVDRPGSAPSGADVDVPFDLRAVATSEADGDRFIQALRAELGQDRVECLVNNAAVQRLGDTEAATLDDVRETLDVNVIVPLRLTQLLLGDLEPAQGSVINISSVHAVATKPGFVAYATSKAALSGMSRAMAIDLGGRVRVNAIELAATETPMLSAGFEGRAEDFRRLAGCHPIGRIAAPGEVGRVAVLLASPELTGFITGCCLRMDGGVTARLHDPL
jgi:NAD(P)-dependent dehydrogenase (short-subunit alcohol dehydrogenase family)